MLVVNQHKRKISVYLNMDLWKRVKASWKTVNYIFCVLLPVFLLPLAVRSEKESRCLYVLVLLAVYWILGPVHIAVTALLPVVLFPLLGVLSSAEVGSSYMSDAMIMFMGGLIVASAIESSNMHERIALKILLLIGTRIQWLMLGLMITTMFFSMWVSNTAATAMMVPIVDAIFAEMSLATDEDEPVRSIELDGNSPVEDQRKLGCDADTNWSSMSNNAALKKVLLLSVAYSANLGGTGTLTGNLSNLISLNLLQATYPEFDDITYASWMAYNVPGMILCVLFGWLYLYLVFVRSWAKTEESNKPKEKEVKIRRVLVRRYAKLGKFLFQEAVVTTLFLLLVMLWIFRKPKFIAGWEDALGSDVGIGDSVAAIGVTFLLFLIPKNPRNLTGGTILDWKKVQAELPWGLFLLIGGGVSLAKGANKSGLSRMMVQGLSTMKTLNRVTVTVVVCAISTTITEIFLNLTAVTLLFPVVNEMAISMKINPLFLFLPVSIASSYAFMLPIATAPNAIVFDRGQMNILDMAKPGFVMNLICCCVQVFMINVLGVALFNLNDFPEWAMEAYNATLLKNGTNVGHAA